MRIGGESPSYEMVPITPEADGAAPALAKGEHSGVSFQKALRGIGRAVDGGERLVAGAASGNLGDLDSGQLIALQAGIYRYSEAVDLVAKLVDRASTAVKTVVSPH
ncbi:MAG TPA: hypothetical protein VHB79_22780 [Polyangiaceae bacterium]|nr:hypothetical protein [Polyangiaceae bacterium]